MNSYLKLNKDKHTPIGMRVSKVDSHVVKKSMILVLLLLCVSFSAQASGFRSWSYTSRFNNVPVDSLILGKDSMLTASDSMVIATDSLFQMMDYTGKRGY